MKKKILYIITQSEWGGAGVYVYSLADKLPKDKFEVAVASGKSASKELVNKLVTKNVRTYPLKKTQRSINPLADIAAVIELFKLIKSFNPDIVHLNSSKVSIIGSIAAKLARVPKVIYTAHGWVFNEPNSWIKNTFYLISEKLTIKMKDHVICVSEFDKKVAEKKKLFPQDKLIAIHNGIDLNKLHFYDKDTARDLLSEKIGITLPSHKKIIGTIANLYKTKGHIYLIEAAKHITDALFIILGEGPERADLEKRIKAAGLEKRFLLPGTVKNGYQYLKAFDVFTLPSVKEGLSYTLMEAVAAELPIVATNVGGSPEIVGEENLISPHDTRTLTKKLLSPQINTKKEDISIDTMVAKTIKLYD